MPTDKGQNVVSDPSKATLEAIRWTYFAIVLCVFLLGCLNLWKFLIKLGKWRTTPLLLMYISGQLTLGFAMARLLVPSQPAPSSSAFEFNFQPYLYLDALSISWMWCVGVSQLVTLIELTLKTCSISSYLARL